MGRKNEQNNNPRVIVAKFDFFKQKEEIKRKSKELKGSKFYVSDQFPKEILDRRKKLYPILNENWKLDRRVTLVVDWLYIEGQLYRNKEHVGMPSRRSYATPETNSYCSTPAAHLLPSYRENCGLGLRVNMDDRGRGENAEA
ncbi:hypothetical protein AAFF_G00103290 [Aldrovandia affinis]|uniref:Uncharacterized protein n=1 Tax=Aldrovandia affinis TaxID=143900 RepID=A0AAD7RUJ3_9TELE|nr:hypothetical protein AAFF_G00103290 [Aldrovandia affinis]